MPDPSTLSDLDLDRLVAKLRGLHQFGGWAHWMDEDGKIEAAGYSPSTNIAQAMELVKPMADRWLVQLDTAGLNCWRCRISVTGYEAFAHAIAPTAARAVTEAWCEAMQTGKE